MEFGPKKKKKNSTQDRKKKKKEQNRLKPRDKEMRGNWVTETGFGKQSSKTRYNPPLRRHHFSRSYELC